MSAQVKMNTPHGFPVRLFKSKQDWATWLEKNHRKGTGLWLRLAKKDSGLRSVSYKEALEVALCYGWIDGQKRPESEQTWLQRFLSRSSKSIWSKIPLTFVAKNGEPEGSPLVFQSCSPPGGIVTRTVVP